MLNFWAPPQPGDKVHHEAHFDRSDLEDFGLLSSIFGGVWVVYWLILHFIDHWTFNFIPWYVEIFSFIVVLFYVMCSEEYGANPLKWWPMWFGYSVECKENDILDDKQIMKLGGPYNVYQVSTDTIKFRRQQDAFKYTMFDYRP